MTIKKLIEAMQDIEGNYSEDYREHILALAEAAEEVNVRADCLKRLHDIMFVRFSTLSKRLAKIEKRLAGRKVKKVKGSKIQHFSIRIPHITEVKQALAAAKEGAK